MVPRERVVRAQDIRAKPEQTGPKTPDELRELSFQCREAIFPEEHAGEVQAFRLVVGHVGFSTVGAAQLPASLARAGICLADGLPS